MSYSYLSTTQKDILGNEFFNIHQTFGRPITIWRTAEQIVLVSNPSNNYLFESAPFNDTTQPILVSGTFLARIKYPTKTPAVLFNASTAAQNADQTNLQHEDNDVRITVDATGSAYLFDAKKVTFDDEIFSINSSDRPHGLFAPKFYDYVLRKLN